MEENQGRFPFLLVFIISVLFGIFGALWALDKYDSGLTGTELIEKMVFHGLQGFIAVWIISGIGWVYNKKYKKGKKAR